MAVARRALLKAALGVGAGLAAWGVLPRPTGADVAAESLRACQPGGDPLEHLLAGNRRFAHAWQAAARTVDQAERRRLYADLIQHDCFLDPGALAVGQQPWAALLTCADSRVSPEMVFGVTPGEMFEVRSAGNTAFDAGVASLEYAVVELGVPLIAVMGHSGCGAVKAAQASDPLTPLLEALVQPIRAVLQPGDSLSQAIRTNAISVARALPQRSAVLRDAQSQGTLRIQPLYFDLDTGLVSVL
jgi:carbonic anhydrase